MAVAGLSSWIFTIDEFIASEPAWLTLPGSSMGFKVYVVLNTGNEAGSNAVTVARP
jgi:hypothetical protein